MTCFLSVLPRGVFSQARNIEKKRLKFDTGPKSFVTKNFYKFFSMQVSKSSHKAGATYLEFWLLGKLAQVILTKDYKAFILVLGMQMTW